MIQPKEKILLAMSGGTDSSVAAILLLEQGYDVEGVTFITYSETAEFISEAAQLASDLSIRHHVMDVREPFNKIVVSYFLDEYKQGRTPNPCVFCNEKLKWVKLVEKADELGIDKIATGHYSNVVTVDDNYFISKGVDPAKDQSYFLWRLPQSILKRIYFPLSNLTKDRVKEIAKEKGFLRLSKKAESMGVCFLQDKDISSFLFDEIQIDDRVPGEVISKDGQVVGTHKGLPFYTIGQKRDLGNLVQKSVCVTSIDAVNNRLLIGHPDDLWTRILVVSDFLFADPNQINDDEIYHVRIRGLDKVPYNLANVKLHGDQLEINFQEPVWAITPGQSVVVYREKVLLGGGIID